jgi:GNAT superfamily N-acetyltransferase
MVDIRIVPDSEILSILPLLKILNPNLSDELLTLRLQEMIKQNYICVGIFDNDKIIGCSGLWILTKYYVGRHIEPDNVIILPEYRGKGIGKQLMRWIYNYAKENNCEASELNCYIANAEGQKFWMNEGYKIIGFHYQKKIE